MASPGRSLETGKQNTDHQNVPYGTSDNSPGISMPGLRYKKYAESRRGRQNECCVSRLLSIVPTGTLIFNPDRALQTPVIRIAEGYWPWGFRRLRFNLIDTLDIRVNHWGEQLDELQDEIKEL